MPFLDYTRVACRIFLYLTMNLTDSAFIGIDPTSGQKSFTFAALDRDLHLLELSDGEIEDVVAFLGEAKSAFVAINAPAGINHGLVRARMKKEMLTPHQIRGAEFRMAEYELRERGIAISGTPANQAMCPGWMQLGFELFRRLEEMGFRKYPERDSALQVLETHPHACFCVMAGSAPLSKPSLEGRLQRQLLLHDHGVRINDPMDFFEEITRYKLARGIWPMELLYLPEQLDALVAAYTAWLAIGKKDQIVFVGDEQEGQIVLPGAGLKDRY
jgi:predicted nuclease with RNAse H fold